MYNGLYEVFGQEYEAPYCLLLAAQEVLGEVADSPVGDADEDVVVLKHRLDSVLEELTSHTQEPYLVLKLFHLHQWVEMMNVVPETRAESLHLPLAYVGELIGGAIAEARVAMDRLPVEQDELGIGVEA